MDTSTEKSDRTLVLGLGNRVMTDDGVGPLAVDRFRERYATDDAVDFMDGGTLGLELLVYMDGYPAILIVDCIQSGRAPGEVVRVEGSEVEAVFEKCLSPHQMGIKDLLAVMSFQGRLPERLTVVGVEGACIDLGTEPTDVVASSVEEATRRMAEILTEWGIGVRELQAG